MYKLEQLVSEDSFYKIQLKYIVHFGILEEAKIEEHKIIYCNHNLTISRSRDKISEISYCAEIKK